MLLPADQEHLEQLDLEFEVIDEAGFTCVVIKGWSLPEGYVPRTVDLLLRLAPGFPDVPPDMFWCDPQVRVAASGQLPQAADQTENYVGRSWQRFSRHLPEGAWQPSRDNLASYLALIYRGLARELGSA